jgi:UDP:flavonoid glycosyltransferase YjiC (YdhE family)
MPQPQPLPSLLFVSHPLTGHLNPTLRVAAALSHDSFPVFFLGPTTQKARISAAGRDITFLPLLSSADFDDLAYYSPDTPNPPTPEYFSLSWQQRGLIDLEKTWIDTIPDEWRSVVAALKEVKARESQRKVIVVAEALFFGIMPMLYGAELPEGMERPRTVALSVTVPFIRSVDVPAFFVGEDGRGEGWKRWEACTRGLKGRMEEKLREAGALLEKGLGGAFLSGQNYTCHDAILQLGAPGWFYPRSDWPGSFKFVGVLPPAEEPIAGSPNLPVWWDEVKGARQKGKKVVVVAQGTVEVDPNDLILPTLRAMAGRTSDLLVVAILGRKGGTLPSGYLTPENARVADYLHYDAVLPYANAWVHNGGYGAVQHGIAHGVPMLVAGEGMDKVENANRIQRCGVGVNLGRPGPSPEAVKKAVDAVLDDERYKRVAASLRNESLDLTCFDAVRSEVLRLSETSEDS